MPIIVDPIEASDQGWTAGHWPRQFTLGTQTWFHVRPTFDRDGELISMSYYTKDCKFQIEVFND